MLMKVRLSSIYVVRCVMFVSGKFVEVEMIAYYLNLLFPKANTTHNLAWSMQDSASIWCNSTHLHCC
jgi:hypothetical protein